MIIQILVRKKLQNKTRQNFFYIAPLDTGSTENIYQNPMLYNQRKAIGVSCLSANMVYR